MSVSGLYMWHVYAVVTCISGCHAIILCVQCIISTMCRVASAPVGQFAFQGLACRVMIFL